MDRDELKLRLGNCSKEVLVELLLDQWDGLDELSNKLAMNAYNETMKTVGRN